MDLVLILGPMASGKSLEMVARMSPLALTAVPHGVFQSARHLRDTHVSSRVGAVLPTEKVTSLGEVPSHLEVVGIDEVHMFSLDDVAHVNAMLGRGTQVVASGIDTDHRGELFPVISALLALGPATVLHRRAVCDVCRTLSAVHTQVLDGDTPYLDDLRGRALPADGTFRYESRCRTCFVRP